MLANPFIVDEVRYFSSATFDGHILVINYAVFNTRTAQHRIDRQLFIGNAAEFVFARNPEAANFLAMQIESMLTGEDGPASYSPTFWAADMPKSDDKEH